MQCEVKNLGSLKIIGEDGHLLSLLTWTNEKEAEEVKLIFEDHIRVGFIAFIKTDSKNQLIREFQKHAENIIMFMPIAGG